MTTSSTQLVAWFTTWMNAGFVEMLNLMDFSQVKMVTGRF